MQKDDVIYRQQAIDAIDRERKKKHLFNTAEDGLLEARGVINTLPSALPCPEGFDPEHLTEQDKKDILEALDWVKGTITEEVPSAQPESCGDVISREYLKEHIEACWINGRPRHAPELNELLSWIDEVPSAEPERWSTCFDCPLSHGCPVIKGCTNEQAMQYAGEIPNDCPQNKISEEPERPKGEWTATYSDCDGDVWVSWKCSNCGYVRKKGWKYIHDGKKPDALFCEMCNADMRGDLS